MTYTVLVAPSADRIPAYTHNILEFLQSHRRHVVYVEVTARFDKVALAGARPNSGDRDELLDFFEYHLAQRTR